MKSKILFFTQIFIFCSVFLCVSSSVQAALPIQSVTLSPSALEQSRGTNFKLTANYNVIPATEGDPVDNTLHGISIRFHFNSTTLKFKGFTNSYQPGFQGGSLYITTPVAEGGYDDGDPDTDVFVKITYYDFNGEWPNTALPLAMTELNFTILLTADTGITPVNLTAASVEAGYQFVPGDAAITVVTLQAPVINSITPCAGLIDGGETMSITGKNFINGVTVKIGQEPAADIVLSSNSLVTCTIPAHEAGSVEVYVRNPDGQSATLNNGYTYFEPYVPPEDTDGDGVPDQWDTTCPDTPADSAVYSDGCKADDLYTALADKEQTITTLTETLDQKNQEITTLNNSIAEKDQEIADLTADNLQKDQTIAAYHDQVATLNQQITTKDAEIAALNETITLKENQILSLNDDLYEKNQEIETLEADIASKDQIIAGYSDSLAQANQQITQLTEQVNQLNAQVAQLEAQLENVYTQEELDAALAAERQRWDMNEDGVLDLREALNAIQTTADLRQ